MCQMCEKKEVFAEALKTPLDAIISTLAGDDVGKLVLVAALIDRAHDLITDVAADRLQNLPMEESLAIQHSSQAIMASTLSSMEKVREVGIPGIGPESISIGLILAAELSVKAYASHIYHDGDKGQAEETVPSEETTNLLSGFLGRVNGTATPATSE